MLVTISDRKIQHANGTAIDYYLADVMNANDYYPFGMLMPARSYLTSTGGAGGGRYRFGFNGKENDNEVKGEGNEQDYGMRIYDPRVGRFLSIDPLTRLYPMLTPYQFASNRPIDGSDLDGEEWELRTVDYSLRHQAESTRIPNPTQDYIRRCMANPEVLMRDVNGVGVMGKKSDVIASVASAKRQHDVALADNITGGVGGSVGYLVGGEKGAAVGAAVDQGLFAFGGVPGRGYLSKPKGKLWVENVPNTEQVVTVHSGNDGAAKANEASETSNRPSWQQTEADVVPSDYRPQVAFKNGVEVPMNTKGSVRPEGYRLGESIEAKNYTLTTETGIKSLIRNVTKQVRQRQANLPAKTMQNIVIDARGQDVTIHQLMKIRSRLMTQTGMKNVNVSFRTN